MLRGFVRFAVRALACTGIICAVAVSTADAQVSRPPSQSGRQVQQPTGTGVISGRVVAADNGRPVRRARVLVTASELPGGRAATTGEDGTYLVTDLPAGRYTVSASKTGFVAVAYGQQRPLRPGTPVQVANGQTLKGIDLRLAPGCVITGHVLDDMNEPLARVTVRVARYQYAAGQRTQTVIGTDQTDDRGEYRVYGLPPGTYYVSATAPPTASESDGRGGGGGGRGGGGRGGQGGPGGGGRGGAPPDATSADGQPAEDAPVTFVPTYYPGAPSPVDAVAVVVASGQEATGIDFPLQQYRAVRVGGVVVSGDGDPIAGGQVFLSAEDARGGLSATNYTARVDPGGSFAISGVPTGRYLLTARVASSVADPLFGSQPFSIGDQDLSGLTVMARAGGWLSGVVSFDTSGNTQAPGNLTRVRVQGVPLTQMQFGGRFGGSGGSSSFQFDDRTFLLDDMPPGLWTVNVMGVPAPWALKGVYLNGRDVSDSGVEARPGDGVEDLSVVFTSQPTQVSGTVETSSGAGLNDYAVVAFSTDKSHWRAQSRRVRVVRTDQSGRFTIDGLPAGTYYVAATDDVDEGEWYEPAFLEGLRTGASSLTIGDGEIKSLTIRVKTPGRH